MYAPFGNQGVSLLRAHIRYENISDAQGYRAQANANTILLVQIDSEPGLENLKQILDIDGIDVAFVGLTLSAEKEAE